MNMELYPAIDLYEGKVIRLTNGVFGDSRVYHDNPLEVARSFIDAGCRWIHLIDLEGAKTGHPVHLRVLEKIANLGCSVQYGGGLRTELNLADAINTGATRVYSGSLIARGDTAGIFGKFGTSVVPSVDIKKGKVAISGWTETTVIEPADMLNSLHATGYKNFLVTSVSRDGTGTGPDLPLYQDLLNRCPDARIIAAGGVTTMEDISKLAKMGLSGAILGTCLYEGTVNLAEALQEVAEC